MPVGRLERVVGVITQRAFGVLLLGVSLVALLWPRNSWFVFNRPVVTVVAGVVVLALVVLRRHFRAGSRWDRLWRGRRSRWWPAALALLGSALYTASAVMRFGWDAGTVARGAAALLEGGELDAARLDYFARFPNNVPLLAVESAVGWLGALVGLPVVASLLIWHVLLVGVIVWSLGEVGRVLGHPRQALVVQAAAAVLIGLTPHVAAPYSDLPAAAGVSLALLAGAYALRATQPRSRWLLLLLAVVLTAVATAFKPYVGVMLIAGALVGLTVAATSVRHVVKAVVGVGIAALVTGATITGVNAAAGQTTGLTREYLAETRPAFPVELWAASGTYDSQQDSPVRRYGAYNQSLVDATSEYSDVESQQVFLREVIRDQLTGRSATQNLWFFSAKVAWVWGDGTFWASGEGFDSKQPTYHQGGPLEAMSEWTMATGEHYPLKAALTQGIWLGGLLFLTWCFLGAPYDRWRYWCALAMLGMTAYLVIFEARPRYLLALLPVLLCAGLTHPPRLRAARSQTAIEA